MPDLLSDEEIESQLDDLEDWEVRDKKLHREFEFSEYMDGLEFVNEVAELSERANHHPDLLLGWCRVEVSIVTHSVGGITDYDLQLAERIDSLLQ